MTMQMRLKKALRKEPPTTLPKFLQRRRTRGRPQEVVSPLLCVKYHSTALPEMT
jgi:hypothetical protein